MNFKLNEHTVWCGQKTEIFSLDEIAFEAFSFAELLSVSFVCVKVC